MKFAHLADCHLGGWRQPELKELNFRSFQKAVEICRKERVDFVLIAGDLFDSAYPPIETLKDTFREFRKLKEDNIPVFLIAGSHDYSVSGKTFLEVLEKAGFCKNVSLYEEKQGRIILNPTIFKNVAIYGYPGKKSSLEVEDLERVKIMDAPGMFKILMLHTSIRDAIGNIPVKAVDETKLPPVDYVALGHLHVTYAKNNLVYAGPIFPNTISELADLGGGSFYIYENGKVKRQEIKLKEVLYRNVEISNGLRATDEVISLFEKENVKDKIVILRLSGILESGKISDINFGKISAYLKQRGAYVFLKSTSRVHTSEADLKIDIGESLNLENQILQRFEESNPSKYNSFIDPLIKALQVEKLDDEKSSIFEERLITEAKRTLNYEA